MEFLCLSSRVGPEFYLGEKQRVFVCVCSPLLCIHFSESQFVVLLLFMSLCAIVPAGGAWGHIAYAWHVSTLSLLTWLLHGKDGAGGSVCI